MQTMAIAGRSTGSYEPLEGTWDEAFGPDGTPRTHYAPVIDRLESVGLKEVESRVSEQIRRAGVSFAGANGSRPFCVDPVPRLIEAEEWSRIEAGVAQRMQALDALARDVYSDRRIVTEGVVPARVIDEAEGFESDLVGIDVPAGIFTHVCGLDLVRCADGTLRVLEDNARSPSGIAYAQAARTAVESAVGTSHGCEYGAIDADFRLLADAIRSADPTGTGDPTIAIATDGPSSGAWYEHRTLSSRLGMPLVALEDFELKGERVGYRDDRQFVPVDVIYRRTDLDRLRSADGRLTRWGELLLGPLKAGRVACVNAFGTGVVDDKLTHAYLERAIRFYLGEAPLLESVKTYDPCSLGSRATIMSRLDELVAKPRSGLGGHDVVIGAAAGADQLSRLRARIADDPCAWVAQETVSLSTHPTVVGGVLEPRRVDLRPYAVFTDEGVKTLNGCLTRVALEKGGLIVNSSANGGGKDTWVMTR